MYITDPRKGHPIHRVARPSIVLRPSGSYHLGKMLGQASPFLGQPGSGVTRGDIDFEFDLNYGMEETAPPNASVGNQILDSKLLDPTCRTNAAGTVLPRNLTSHERRDGAGDIKDGFDVRMDGNRIEISTTRFSLDTRGKGDLIKTADNIIAFVGGLKSRCAAASLTTIVPPPVADRITRKPLGKPRHFTAPFTSIAARPLFPLGTQTYFRDKCEISAAPQATMDIPLSSVNALVTAIGKSRGKRPGVALTGSDQDRAGVKSDALFNAQVKVNRSREALIKAGVVTRSSFSANLQGFMILLVQYFWTSEIRYGSGDFEGFAKAYVPLHVKTHFRDLFHRALNNDERKVFNENFGNPAVRNNLYALAGRSTGGGSRNLFPGPDVLKNTAQSGPHNRERVQQHQDAFFSRRLKWDDLVQMTIDDTQLKVDVSNDLTKCLGVSGNESLFTPLASASNGPARAGPDGARVQGVRLELRRMGFDWVPSSRWKEMMGSVFELSRKLNK